MFRIGDFSRLARVSSRLLRFYDEIGLLEPAYADAQSGYRFYSIEQLARLNRITVLKDLGFSLDQIGELLKTDIPSGQLRSLLVQRRREVERTLAIEAQRLRHIEIRIAQIESDGRMFAEDVVVRAEPPRQMLSLRRTIASFAESGEMIDLLHKASAPMLPARHTGKIVVVSHAQQFEADALDLEFGLVFDGEAPIRSHVMSELTVGELPAVERMAVCVRTGAPDEGYLLTSRIGVFLAQNGEEIAGPNRELFLHFPASDRMHEAVLEMQFPLRAS